MNIGQAIVQGGLLSRDVDSYNDLQGERALRARQIQSGIQRMDDDAAARPERLRLEQLRRDIERGELEYRQRSQGADQALVDADRQYRAGEIQHRSAMQPGRQQLEQTQQRSALQLAPGQAQLAQAQQQAALTQAQTQAELAPGQATIAKETQGAQLQALKEQQLVRLWGLYRAGDTQGFLDALNNSGAVAPGRKFSKVHAIDQQGPNGQRVRGIALEPADGGQPIALSFDQLEALEHKYGTKYEKVGSNLVKIGPRGDVTPVYEQDQFIAAPEGSSIVSRRTGQSPGGAAGGGSAPSLPRRWQENFEKALPQREALDSSGNKKIDMKTGTPMMETDETLAPVVRDMVRGSADVLAKAKISPEEAAARFGDFAKAMQEQDPTKAFNSLDQAGRLIAVTNAEGVPVKLVGRIGTAADGSPIVVELPTGLEKLLLDVELNRRFVRGQEAAGVDEGARLRGTHPNRGPTRVGKVRRPPAASGIQ